QPSMNSLVAALQGRPRDTGIDAVRLDKLSEYWGDVRLRYCNLEEGIKYPAAEIYRYEIPGGQYTNLKPQADSLGLGQRFDEIKEMYATVDRMLGGIIKVTPSSKMVGDLAIFMVQNNLTPENIVKRGDSLSFPDSVVSYFSGMMGQPSWGFPEDLQKVVLKGKDPITVRPGELLPPVDFEKHRQFLMDSVPKYTVRSDISYALYDKMVEAYINNISEFANVTDLSSDIFFHGMPQGMTDHIQLGDGKEIVVKFISVGELQEDGTRYVTFEVNGEKRDVLVVEESADVPGANLKMADPNDPSEIASSIPGLVSRILVKPGDAVKKNDVLMIVEAMKMEASITANTDGVVVDIFPRVGDTIVQGALLVKLT
ncbi:MAG: biotin/lipoyl-binding protein, partial [Clostridiales Family XIII bacterium]|nr:biotin/lipoyl-binding protein [Clostridiales Family XIII bacterium]